MKTTIYHVAEEAGVSIATVSKVINNTGSIHTNTRKKVLQVIERLNFYPNRSATALAGKQTKTIGLLVSDLSAPFFSELTKGIHEECHKRGFHIMVCSTDGQREKEKNYFATLLRQGIDGFIISSDHYSMIIEAELKKHQIPGVFITAETKDHQMPLIAADNYGGGCQAVRHLLSLRHRKVAMIKEKSYAGEIRLRAFRDTMQEASVPIEKDFIIETDSSIENGYKSAKKLLALKDKPTAIFACNDLMAIGAIKAAMEINVAIPSELSIIGFDNISICEFTMPPLTTISQPIHAMGEKAVEVLAKQVQQETPHIKTLIIKTNLVIRKSTSLLTVNGAT